MLYMAPTSFLWYCMTLEATTIFHVIRHGLELIRHGLPLSAPASSVSEFLDDDDRSRTCGGRATSITL